MKAVLRIDEKSALSIRGKTLLQWNLDNLLAQGFDQIFLLGLLDPKFDDQEVVFLQVREFAMSIGEFVRKQSKLFVKIKWKMQFHS